MMKPKFGSVLAVATALALLPQRAEATPPFDLLGDSLGMGGQLAPIIPGGGSAAYFNPALLTDAPAGGDAGFVWLAQRIGVSLQPRPGLQYDVPADQQIDNAVHSDLSSFDDYPIPTKDLQIGRVADDLHQAFKARPRQAAGTGKQNLLYLTFGLNMKFLKDRLALGITGLFPLRNFTVVSAFYSDEREQYYSNSLHPELYGDRLTAPSIALGAGVKVIEGLSLGVGATLGFHAPAVASTHVADINRLDHIGLVLNAPVKLAFAPHFGASWTLANNRIRLSGVAHAPTSMRLDAGFSFLIGSSQESQSSLGFVLNYVPWRTSFGGAWDIVHHENRTLTVAGMVTYARWSTYVDRHGEKPSGAYAWYDTLSPTIGARYRTGPISTLLDLSYVPSPVPAQTGRSNYVDNDRITGAVGADYAFTLFGLGSRLGLQLQTHYLLERQQNKLPTPTDPSGKNIAPQLVKDEVPDDAQVGGHPVKGREGLQTNNPGWPGFSSDGIIVALSLYYKLAF